jgi:hypothetical protein
MRKLLSIVFSVELDSVEPDQCENIARNAKAKGKEGAEDRKRRVDCIASLGWKGDIACSGPTAEKVEITS